MLTISQALHEEVWPYHGHVSTSAYEKLSSLGIGRVNRVVNT
jgi:hypothetical protein